MDKVKQSWQVCRFSLRLWATNARVYVLAILLILLVNELLTPVRVMAQANSVSISSWIFPFLMTNPFHAVLFFVGIILLFCDAPFLTTIQPLLLIRTKRSTWLLGQVLYIMIGTAIYFLYLYVLSLILVAPELVFSKQWGVTLQTLAQTDIGREYSVRILVPYNLLSTFSPMQCLGLSFLLLWLTGVFLGMLVLFINLSTSRALGPIIAAFLNLFSIFAINGSGYFLLYISPVTWAGMRYLDFAGSSAYPSLSYVLVGLGSLNIILLVGCILGMKKHVIEVQLEQ